MSLTISKPSLRDYAFIAERMGEDERRQFLISVGSDIYLPDAAARLFAGQPGLHYVFSDSDGIPVSLAGVMESAPGVWQTWMANSADAFAIHGSALTRQVRRMMDELLAAPEVRRVQTIACVCRRAAHVWYERGLGMTREGVLRRFYTDGTDAVMFARVAP